MNWNRRAIFVKDIVTSAKTKPEEMASQTAIWMVKNEDEVEVEKEFPLQIDGWEDRNKRPHGARIDLVLLLEQSGSEPGAVTDKSIPFPRDAKIAAKIQMLGNVHRIFDIEADAFPKK